MRCEICGLGYVPEYPPDAARHRREHDEFIHGIAAKPLRSDSVVFGDGVLRITLVRPGAPIAQRKRVERIGRRANWETEYDFGVYGATEAGNLELDIHALVGHRNDRAIALLIFERRSRVWISHWGPDAAPCDAIRVENSGPRWTVGFVWVLAKYRRRGVALKLLEQASRHTHVPLSDLGWYTPFSDAGKALAKHLCPGQFYIVK
jgi:hypothetical protein